MYEDQKVNIRFKLSDVFNSCLEIPVSCLIIRMAWKWPRTAP